MEFTVIGRGKDNTFSSFIRSKDADTAGKISTSCSIS